MKIKPQFKQFETQITMFLDLFRQGKEVWLKAGELLVTMIDASPDIIEYLVSLDAGLKSDTLEALERIGRKRLLPELLLDDSMGARRLASLPYKVQCDVYANGLDIVSKRAGAFIVERKPVGKLTFNQVFTAFGPDGIRSTEAQQKQLLKQEDSAKHRNVRYAFENGGSMVHFFKDCRMTIEEVKQLLANLEKVALESAATTLQPAMQKNQVQRKAA